MSKVTYSILPTSRTSMQFNVHDDQPVQLCRYGKEMLPVEEVVSIMLCSGMSTDEIFVWLERRMEIGKFTPITEQIQ